MKIAINGVGIAGPTLAYWLHQYGHEPVLFEKAPELRTGGYVIDFWGSGYDVADRMGLLPTLHERGYHMECLKLVDDEGATRATVDVAALRDRLRGRFLSIPRGDIAATIFEACSNVETRFGVSIEGIDEASSGIVATLSDGTRETFELVVGADGLHSRVRALTFASESDCFRDLGCRVAAFRLVGYRPRDELAYVSRTVPGKQVARVSLRDDVTLVLMIWLADESEPVPVGLEAVKSRLRQVFGGMSWEVPKILEGLQSVESVYVDRVSQVHLPHWTRGRVALAGDAAACASFLAGEGTGLAMTEAYVLAGELHRAHGDHAAAFRAYERKLEGFLKRKQKGALRTIGFFAPRSRIGISVRDWLANRANHPFIARQIVESAVADTLPLPDYAAA